MSFQEMYITELLDPRSALSARENAAAQEILWLRSQFEGVKESWKAPTPPQKADKGATGKREAFDK